jgi:hypothetical protein
MRESIKELEKEGRAIAEKLGNGVTYLGPWFHDEEKKEFLWHTFNDDPAFTGTTFTAKTFQEAKEKLIEKRKLFGMPLPNFQHLEPS